MSPKTKAKGIIETRAKKNETMEQIDSQLIASLATEGTVSKNIKFEPISTSDDGIPLYKILTD